MAKTAILLITGSELVRGETRDANGPFLAANLAAAGFSVREISIVGDDPEDLSRAIRRAAESADLVVISGGLGPTSDDRTVVALAGFLGRGTLRDPQTVSLLRERARMRGIQIEELPENYWKQAEVVEGAEVLPNPVGLAPGQILPGPRGPIVVLPGVPKELRAILRQLVLPRLAVRFELEPPAMLRANVFGLPESRVEARIQELGIDFSRLEYGISAKPGEILVRMIARNPSDSSYLEEVRGRLEAAFAPGFVSLEESPPESGELPPTFEHARVVHDLLLRARVTLATAESCTGGLIAKLLTDNPGSSGYFRGSVVAYHDDAKRMLLGVPEAALRAHGAVSEEVCRQMALSARERFGADYALSTTGIAGPGGGTAAKPVGLVFIGIACAHGEATVGKRNFWGNRETIRQLTAVEAFEMLRRTLAGTTPSQERSSGGT